MPLQQLVEYFNDRLEREHGSAFRPFVIHQHKVEGLFGPIRVGSHLLPLHALDASKQIAGYAAQLLINHDDSPHFDSAELDHLLNQQTFAGNQAESVIHFDRLTRTVHMLNYLPTSHHGEWLFLDVDPRHILGIKTDHGAYFEEIIQRCGLETRQIVITLSIHGLYNRFYQSLLKGLGNYQRRAYKIAIKFDYQNLDKSILDLIERAGSDFIGLSLNGVSTQHPEIVTHKLQTLLQKIRDVGSKSYLFNSEEFIERDWPILHEFDFQQAADQDSSSHAFYTPRRVYR